MRSFDDLTPEQIEERHEALVKVLKGTYRTPEVITPLEEASIIERVRARLSDSVAHQDTATPYTPISQPGSLAAPLQRSPVRRHPGRIALTINVVAAVLIIGLLLGSVAILLTIYHPQPSIVSSPAPIVNTNAHIESNGLEFSLHISSGPYFISQMVLADASLTNHSGKTYKVFGASFVNACGTTVSVTQSEGSDPHYGLPVVMTHSCPASLGRPFASGATITIHQYTPLTSSGRITLSAHVAYDGSDERTASAFRLLARHWPSISIYVDAKVPHDRTLMLKRVGNQVTVLGPNTARPLLYAYNVSCNGPQGNTWTGNFAWEVQSTSVIKQTNCPGQQIHWNYAVAAVGYAIASGSIDFP